MKRIEHSVDISAPIARVWALTTDVAAWPSLMPTVTSVEPLDSGALAVGSSVRLKQPGQARRLWKVTVFEPERRFVWRTAGTGFAITAAHTLTPAANGATRNELAIEIDGPLAGVLSLLAGRKIRNTLAIENDAFRRAAERQDARP